MQTNFFGHPYHGGLTFTSARAVGLGFWESASYTLFGSLTWELFAETEPPSINDLLMTTLAGLMLGESTFRLSSQLLDDASSGSWRGLRELAAAVLSPMRGFNRLYMKEAWQSGPSPKRRAIDAAVEVGVEALRATASTASEAYRPSLLLAADISYGDLLPATPSSAFEPFEFFELYAAVSLLNSELSGAQVYTTGLLYGRGIGEEGERRRLGNQHILGFSMTYDFQGSNLATYGGVGLGPVYYWVLRSRQRPSLRLGVGLDLVPILGVTATESDGHQRAYNFGAGAAFWAAVRWHLDTFGELQVRSRQYVTAALDGVEGADYVGATRLSLEVDMLRGVGVGVAPLLVYRRRLNAETDATTLQVQAQAYLKLQL